MVERDDVIGIVATRHGLSEGAVTALWAALARGGGGMAQFSHPDLGGMGQWSGGGMIQIGDMFNAGLKARVAAACADLAAAASGGDAVSAPSSQWQWQGREPALAATPARTAGDGGWWGAEFGRPAASGSQNGLRYAYFAEARRLAIERDGHVTLYDTGHHRIFGVSQQQSRGQDLAFTAEDGTVDLARLTVLDHGRRGDLC